MAEVVLAAEVGRPLGSRAVRRLRREGKIPGVIYGHGTEPVPIAVVARELRVALNTEAGANQLLSLDTGSGTYLTIAREMQRHPVAQTVTHVDFVIVRRDEVISADVPITLVGEALEVHHGDGLVEQQMFTLPIRALPGAIPTVIEADISELTIGGQVRVSDLSLPDGRHHRHRPRDRGRHRPAAACRHARGGGRRGRGRGGRRGRGREAERGRRPRPGRRGLGPAPPLRPVRAPGHPGGPAGRRAGQSRRGVRREPAQRRVRRGRAAGRSATVRRCGPRRASRPGPASSRWAAAGWPWPSRRPT